MAVNGAEIGTIYVKVTPDLDGFYTKCKAALETIEKQLEGKIKVGADLTKFHREVAAATKRMPEATIDVDANTKGVRQKIEAQTKGIKAKVDVDVDRSFLDRIRQSMGNLKAPNFGTGINPTGYMLILSGIAAITPLIAGSLGAIVTSVLTLPGILAGLAIPFSVLALGAESLGQAFERIVPQYNAMREAFNKKIAEQFTPVIDKLANFFPFIERMAPVVSGAMAEVANSFVDMLQTPENMGTVEQIVNNISEAIRRAGPGINSFTEGLLGLAEGFTKHFPDISDWFNETGESFKKWVQDFTKEGPDGTSKFDRALGTLGDTLKLLGGGLVELANKALDFFSDPEKVKSFKAELDGLVNTILFLTDCINKLAAAMSKIPGFSDGEANSVFDFAPIQVQLLADAFTNFDWSSAFAGLKMAASLAFGQIVLTAGTTVGQIVATFLSLPGQLMSVFGQVVANAAVTVGQIVAQFANVPGQVGAVWNSLIGIAASIFSAVVSQAAALIPQVVTVFVTVGGQILAEVQSWPGKIVGALGNLAGELRAAGERAGQALIQGLAGAISAGVGAVAGAVGRVMAAARALIPNSPAKEGPFSGSGWSAVTNFGKTIGDAMMSHLPEQEDRIVGTIRKILEAIKEVFGEAANLNLNFNFGSAITSGLTAMSDAAYSAKSALSSTVGNTVTRRKLDAQTQAMADQLSLQKDELEVERQKLQNQKNLATDKATKAALQSQIDAINLKKDELELQREQLMYQAKYTDQVQATDSVFGDIHKKLYDSVKPVAEAPIDQFMSDLGISGNGALPQLLKQGIAFGEQFIFNVSSMDEAISGQQTIQNKKALQYQGGNWR